MEKKDDKYSLESKFEIIEIYYFAGKLKLLGIITFSELNEISFNKISIKEAAHL